MPSSNPRSPSPASTPVPARIARLALLLLGVLAGCGGDPGDRLPEGLTLAGRTDAVVPVLERLEALERTPLATEAAALRGRIAGCELFVAHCPPAGTEESADGSAPACRLAETAGCAETLPDWLVDDGAGERGPAGWGLARRVEDGLWLVLRARAGDGAAIVLEGEAGPVGLDRAISLLMPAAEPPGPPRLASARALLQVRVRPDGGLNLARFVEGEGWGARMYRLRSDLFEGRALAGVWELAVYPPAEGELIPPMALAVDVEEGEHDLAVSAMEQFLGELQEVWPVRRSDYRLGEADGACLGNVRVMPDLAPCYVAGSDALVVGWNPRALELALAGGRGAGPDRPAPAGSGGRIFFSRFPEADRVIARTTGAPRAVDPGFYPWELLELTGRRDESVYRFHLRLGPEAAP